MLTVLESINLSTDYLAKKGIESPKLNAELLLAHILKCKRLDLYLSFDRPLTAEETVMYRNLLKRRGSFEPLQYITGTVEFYGLNFKVTPAALIPRPETEILVENVIHSAGSEPGLKILDIGTGSGIIAVSIAKYLNQPEITALDISGEALSLARENAELNGVSESIKFIEADISKENIFSDRFDIVVSNPPYVSSEEYEELSPELKVYEPKLALTDDSDGLRFFKLIISSSKSYLKPCGKIFFEVGHSVSRQVCELMEYYNYKNITIIKDYSGIERVVTGEFNC